MRPVSNKQSKNDEQPAAATETVVAASVTMHAGAPEVSAELSVQRLQKEHAEAVAAEQSLTARQAEIAEIIASKRREVESCAALATSGNQGARDRSMALRQEITTLEFDLDNLQISLRQKKEDVLALFRRHDSALADEQRSAASAELERLTDEAIDADRVFLGALVTIANAHGRLMTAVAALQAPELAISGGVTNARLKLTQAHNDAFDALPSSVRASWSRFWGGPVWANLVMKDAL